MDSNLKLILEEFEKYKGQHVMVDWQWNVERLIAIGGDDMDWYYVTFNGRDIHWNTCVGRIMPLKGFLRDEDYEHILNIARLNDYDQLVLKNDENIDKFLEAVKDDIAKLDGNHVFMTELCWELN
jgi:hypothetical protein